MRVLQFIDSLNIGGAENLVTSFLAYSSVQDSENTYEICTLYDSNSVLKSKLKEKGVTMHSLYLRHKYDIRGIFRLIRLLRKNKYDVVHVHLFPALYFGAVASVLTPDIKYMYTEHSTFNKRRENRLMRVFDRFAYKRYALIINICNGARETLIKYIPSLDYKTRVIYNGIPITAAMEREKEYDLLLVGSLRDAKAIDIFIEAVSLLKQKIGVAAIAGDGPLEEKLKNLRNQLNLNDKIQFLGKRSDVSELLEKSKIFVLSSRWEGIPLSVLEAMSKAKPIACTNVGGIPEIINDDSGILVNCNADELAKAIDKLLENDELSEKLGQEAYRTVVDRFSIEKYAEEIEQVYNTVIVKN